MRTANNIMVAPRAAWQRAHQALAPHERTAFIDGLRQRGGHTTFHYIPLHTAPAGLRYGRPHGSLPVTRDMAKRLVRLPLWIGLNERQVDTIAAAVSSALDDQTGRTHRHAA